MKKKQKPPVSPPAESHECIKVMAALLYRWIKEDRLKEAQAKEKAA